MQHSKFLLVDDRYAQISSANMNDRSFAGDRDSEVGVTVLDDEDKVLHHVCSMQMSGLHTVES